MSALADLCRPVEAEMARYRALFADSLRHNDVLLSEILALIANRGGKQMRPLLVLLVAKECGVVKETALRSALVVQLLHTASIVHDDVVDKSDKRRGLPSVNSVYDNRLAVLVGDYLLSLVLMQAEQTGHRAIIERISRLGAVLAEGEILQLEAMQSDELSEERYYDIIHRKTASLFSACAELGALSMDAGTEFCQRAAELGEYIGMCFQMRDDIFDYYGDSAVGKPTGNDMREGKFSLPIIFALNHYATDEEMALVKRVKDGNTDEKEVNRLIDFTKEHGGIAYAEKQMDIYVQKAHKLISGFRNEPVREALRDFIDYVAVRTY